MNRELTIEMSGLSVLKPYFHRQGVPYKPLAWRKHTAILVLSETYEQPFTLAIYGQLAVFSPTTLRIRFVDEEVTSDSWFGRITVCLTATLLVHSIHLETDMGIPTL